MGSKPKDRHTSQRPAGRGRATRPPLAPTSPTGMVGVETVRQSSDLRPDPSRVVAEPVVMSYIAEDPWPLGIVLAVVAVVSLAALKVTGRGKFLIWGATAAGLAALLFVVEALWVTDAERIEAVVVDMARAAARNDVERVLGHLAPDLVLEQGGDVLDRSQTRGLASRLSAGLTALVGRGDAARALIRGALSEARFDFIHVGQIRPHANTMNRLGTVEFRAYASGSIPLGGTQMNFATDAGGSDWSFGLREVEPGVWKVTRITAVRLPGNASLGMLGRVR